MLFLSRKATISFYIYYEEKKERFINRMPLIASPLFIQQFIFGDMTQRSRLQIKRAHPDLAYLAQE